MTRALKFARIDLMKVWRFFYVLVFPIIAVFAEAGKLKVSAIFSVVYCLFTGIVLSAMPFRLESTTESGFLQLLPAKPGEQVLGHFLFGLFLNLAGFALGIVCAFLPRIVNPAAAVFGLEGMRITGFYPAMLGIALIFTGAQALVMTAMRFHSVHAAQLMRMLPAFVFLFGVNRVAIEGTTDIAATLRALSGAGGLAALGICLLVFAALAWISRCISVARGQS